MSKPEDVTCPDCGGPMVSRLNKRENSRFWGCKRYPDCRGTLNVDGDAEPRCKVQYTPDGGEPEDVLPSDRWRGRDRGRWS
jgi:ssDNA-binding Zn-finger/Zn-ribbon topoisomerase 1